MHLKKGAVTGAKVKRNTLTGTQIAEASLERVPKALQADSADTADSADISRLDYRQSALTAIPDTGVAVRGTATCDAGTFALGGGAKVSNPNVALVLDSNPLGKNAWEANAAAGTASTLTVYVICGDAAASTP